MRNWTIIARHKDWVVDCTIVESSGFDNNKRRFTATICGWTNFKIWEGKSELTASMVGKIQSTVESLRDRLCNKDLTVLDIEGFIL